MLRGEFPKKESDVRERRWTAASDHSPGSVAGAAVRRIKQGVGMAETRQRQMSDRPSDSKSGKLSRHFSNMRSSVMQLYSEKVPLVSKNIDSGTHIASRNAELEARDLLINVRQFIIDQSVKSKSGCDQDRFTGGEERPVANP
jgi:hypothetical protein